MSDTFEKAAYATAAALGTSTETAKSEGSTVMRLWQENTSRLLRANERMMHGMLAALKMEFQLGQDLLEHRITTIKTASQAGKPSEAGHTVMERHVQEMERLVASMREISEEMRKSYGDATKLIFHDAEQQAHELAAAATPKTPAPVPARPTALVKTED